MEREKDYQVMEVFPIGEAICETLVIGKTGVGKSSFINYLYSGKIRETGTGRPVTKKGIFKEEINLGDLQLILYDSWGLEADKAEDWKSLMESLFNGTNTPFSYHLDRPKKGYFHSVIFCIAAPSARVEEMEIQIINTLLKQKNQVAIVLTKADMASQKEKEGIKEVLRESLIEDVPILPVSCEEKLLLSGERLKPYGKEQVMHVLIFQMLETIIYRFPKEAINGIHQEIDRWKYSLYSTIDDIGFFSSIKKETGYIEYRCRRFIDEELPKITKDVIAEVWNDFQSIIQFSLVPMLTSGISSLGADGISQVLSYTMAAVSGLMLKGILAKTLIFGVAGSLFLPFSIVLIRGLHVRKTKKKLKSSVYELADKLKVMVEAQEEDIQRLLREEFMNSVQDLRRYSY